MIRYYTNRKKQNKEHGIINQCNAAMTWYGPAAYSMCDINHLDIEFFKVMPRLFLANISFTTI